MGIFRLGELKQHRQLAIMASAWKVTALLARRMKVLSNVSFRGQVRYLTDGAGSNNISSIANGTLKPPVLADEEAFDINQYKCEEYFNFNPMSFYGIEVDMNKYRSPQPSPNS